MSLWSKIIGTIETKFQIGLGGPQFKQISATEIGFRNAADNANVNGSGLDPTTAQHFATKNYVDTAAAPNVLKEIRMPITNAASQTSTAQIPASSKVTKVQVEIVTPYSAGGTIAVGQTGTTSLLEGTTDNNPQAAGIYEANQDTDWGASPLGVLVTIAGTPAAGAGFVIVQYSSPSV